MIGIVLFASVVTSANAFLPPPKLSQHEIDGYFLCTASFKRSEAGPVMAERSHVGPQLFSKVAWLNCYPPAWVKYGKITFGNYYFAGKLAEALVRERHFKTLPSDVARGSFQDAPAFSVLNEPVDLIAEHSRVVFDCIVKAKPEVASRLIIASHGKAVHQAIAAILESPAACTELQTDLELPPEAIRAAVALSYYRLGTAGIANAGTL